MAIGLPWNISLLLLARQSPVEKTKHPYQGCQIGAVKRTQKDVNRFRQPNYMNIVTAAARFEIRNFS